MSLDCHGVESKWGEAQTRNRKSEVGFEEIIVELTIFGQVDKLISSKGRSNHVIIIESREGDWMWK